MPGTDARKDARPRDAIVQLFLRHTVQFGARQHLAFLPRDAEAGRDGKRRIFMIPRDHNGHDARPAALGDRFAGAPFGRIDHPANAQKDEPLVRRPLPFVIGKPEHAQRSARHLLDRGLDPAAVGFGKRAHRVPFHKAAAAGKKDVRPAFDKPKPLPVRLGEHRHALFFGGKRLRLAHRKGEGNMHALGIAHKRRLRRVADERSALPPDRVAGAHAEQQPAPRRRHPAPFGAARRKICNDLLHRHAVFRKSARLVAADAVTSAQRLHCMQAAHDGTFSAHPLHPHRHDDGHDGGHALGDRRDGDGDRRHKIAERRGVLEQDPENEDDGGNDDDGGGDELAEFG